MKLEGKIPVARELSIIARTVAPSASKTSLRNFVQTTSEQQVEDLIWETVSFKNRKVIGSKLFKAAEISSFT